MISIEQAHLLRATLQTGVQANAALDAWQEATDFDNLDLASYRLLPLLYLNLCEQEIDDPLLPKLAGIYKKVWLANEMMMDSMSPIIELLGRSSLIGEASFAADGRVRPIRHTTFSVPADRIPAVIDDVREIGWQRRSLLKRTLRRSPRHVIVLGDGRHTLRLWSRPHESDLSTLLDDPISRRPSNQIVFLADVFYLNRAFGTAVSRRVQAMEDLNSILESGHEAA